MHPFLAYCRACWHMIAGLNVKPARCNDPSCATHKKGAK